MLRVGHSLFLGKAASLKFVQLGTNYVTDINDSCFSTNRYDKQVCIKTHMLLYFCNINIFTL